MSDLHPADDYDLAIECLEGVLHAIDKLVAVAEQLMAVIPDGGQS